MSYRAGKRRNIYVDQLKGKSKPTCLINEPGYSSYECKVLRDFGSNYAKSRPTKDHWDDTKHQMTFNSQQKNEAIFNSAVDEILLQENQKVSAEKEAHENIESNFDESELYHKTI